MKTLSSSRVRVCLFSCAWLAMPANGAAIPDPLVTGEGKPVTSREQWTQSRRPELLELFREHVYGRNIVERPPVQEFSQGAPEKIFDGRAVRKSVTITYGNAAKQGRMTLHLYIPTWLPKPKGVFLLINNRSPRFTDDAQNAAPGSPGYEFFPARKIVDRGYVAAGFKNTELADDNEDTAFTSGAFNVMGPEGKLSAKLYPNRPADAWAAIAAWAWGTSRAIDFIKSDPALKDLPVAIAGHSRGGKTALWCGAQDTRVDLTISNSSGSTGAAVARIKKGETIARINNSFPHWFCDNYKKFNDREDALPVDQHMLIALCAPRLVYVQSSFLDAHADPAAEFRSCQLATPVYELFGLDGISSTAEASPNKPIHAGAIGYHVRADGYEGDTNPANGGEHDMKAYDWERFMDFADLHFAKTVR